ncbi:DUF2799 domain-containing protein [Parashewanella tropica]|uniref:DUF2799 domain-containing protein n=1 Tax=Parashewanella tropica TaxID=2547970 RepID=UPI0014795802|nr:DUF2799 domain-containing protein [Parashewanella tropica]
MTNKLLVSSLIFPLFLSGCQLFKQWECKPTDWYLQGFNDGYAGNPSYSITTYQNACAGNTEVRVNAQEWQRGYEKGLTKYCRADNGYRIGKSGITYHGVCSNADFIKNYKLGRQQYEIEQRKQQLRSEIRELRNQMANEPEFKEKERLQEQIDKIERRIDNLSKPDVSVHIEF